MQRPTIVKGRSLAGSSDLTLLAPIRPGFAESLESITYKTRIKRVLESLHSSRAQAHEYQAARLLSDSVERVGAILSVRVAVLEPEDKVLLSVSFDGSWESYIRVLWDKVGTLLDLIFCGTTGYVTAFGHSFEEWRAWATTVQVESGFYYGPPESTARDIFYRRRVERMEVSGKGGPVHQLRARVPSAEDAVQHVVHPDNNPFNDDPPLKRPPNVITRLEQVKSGLQGLMALYRLADLHRPGTPDGEVLRLAAIDLLLEFVQLWGSGLINDDIAKARTTRFGRALQWLFPDGVPRPNRRIVPPKPSGLPGIPPAVLKDVQAGIVRPYPKVTHGALLLLAFADPRQAAAFFAWLKDKVTPGDVSTAPTPGTLYCSVGFTANGLRALGMGDDSVELFPEEFRQGMAARAGLLGDIRNNHPSRWRLPVRHGSQAAGAADLVGMDAVHAVLQLRVLAPDGTPADTPLDNKSHPLHGVIEDVVQVVGPSALLATQPMVRRFKPGTQVVEEHFGYADALGQPELEGGGPGGEVNRVHLGEVLAGHDNASDFAPDPADPQLPEKERRRLQWLRNGSFAVVRKYRQFPDRLSAAVNKTALQMQDVLKGSLAAHEETIYAKLMGRERSGKALIESQPENAFTYAADPRGRACPLQSHIRLANPRAARPAHGAARPPRIMRRSMSYGPFAGSTDCGLVFMAYNASLGEQFEVVQRWIAGANGSGSSSGHGCPFLGVPEDGLSRHFRFEVPDPSNPSDADKALVFTVELEEAKPLFSEPAPLARLEWGLYLFAPSLSTLRRLAGLAFCALARSSSRPAPWQTSAGRRQLQALQELEEEQGSVAAAKAWKAALEDPQAVDRLDAAALWAAIREDHGGVLRTPYGVLVADRAVLHQVLMDTERRYSIGGQRERMNASFGGDIYLGLDEGEQYRKESETVNAAIAKLTATKADRDACFQLARGAASRKLELIVGEALENASNVYAAGFEVSFDVREVFDEVLVALCNTWFGIEGSEHFQTGGPDWQWQDHEPPIYPGHFTALSRYMFQPNPGDMPRELSVRYGRRLVEAMAEFVKKDKPGEGSKSSSGSAPITAAVYGHPEKPKGDATWMARTLVGVMMGFTAPLLGSLANIVREWQADGSFWAWRARLAGRTDRATAWEMLEGPMLDAARMRPMPPLIWRTAVIAHHLGPPGGKGVEVEPGDKLVLGLVSGSQQALVEGVDDGRLMFGGTRKPAGEPHPTHACPGYDAATEVMLGVLTALLAMPEELAPGAAPLRFIARGPCPPEAPEDPVGEPTLEFVGPVQLKASVPSPSPQTGLIVAMGDSWFDNPDLLVWRSDLRQELEKFGWTIPNEDPHRLCDYSKWGKVANLKDGAAELIESVKAIVAMQTASLPLRAILISGGGNDSTGSVFDSMLLRNDSKPATPPLDPVKLEAHVTRLKGHYETIISKIKNEVLTPSGIDVPIIVHGYDYSQLPAYAGLKTWFHNWLRDKGYDKAKHRQDRLDALKQLIEAFNVKLLALAGDANFSKYVRYVKLTDTIAGHWTRPVDAWEDDLHVTKEAFRVMATKIHAQIIAPYP